MSVEFTSLHLAAALAGATLMLMIGRSALCWRAVEGVLVKDNVSARERPWSLVACSVLAVMLAALRAETGQEALAAAVFVGGLGYLAILDVRTQLVPVVPTVLLALFGIGFQATRGAMIESVLAAIGAGALMLGLASLYRRVRGRDGLGAGDALVVAAIAAWLGATGAAWSVGIGAMALLAFVLAMRGGERDAPAPLVPGLAVGTFAVLMIRGLG